MAMAIGLTVTYVPKMYSGRTRKEQVGGNMGKKSTEKNVWWKKIKKAWKRRTNDALRQMHGVATVTETAMVWTCASHARIAKTMLDARIEKTVLDTAIGVV